MMVITYGVDYNAFERDMDRRGGQIKNIQVVRYKHECMMMI